MTEMLTQPGPGLNVETTDRDSLIMQLDHLLERYLNTLDQYQKTQQQLTANLSSGYFSLAQANFNNHSRIRYGQDYYDERMQASRKITLTDKESSVAFSVSAPDFVVPSQPGLRAEESADSPREPSESVPAESSATPTEPSEVNNASSNNSKTCVDPLQWFGILVPPALRSAQTSFVSAVEEPIPLLATLLKDLREQEINIARLRKQIKKS